MDTPNDGIFFEREMQVLKLLDEGRSLQEIATMMMISTTTVKNHMRNVAEKLKLRAETDPG